jgi:hypothetical protein
MFGDHKLLQIISTPARHNHSPIARFTQQLLSLMRARLSKRDYKYKYIYIETTIYMCVVVSHSGCGAPSLSHSIMSCSLAKSRPQSAREKSANFIFITEKCAEQRKRGAQQKHAVGCFSHLHPGCAQSRGDIYNSASLLLLLLLHVRRSFMYTPGRVASGDFMWQSASRLYMYVLWLRATFMLRGEQIFSCAVGCWSQAAHAFLYIMYSDFLNLLTVLEK